MQSKTRASKDPKYHGRSSPAWKRMRAAILKESDICWLCGRPGADTIDHVIPLAKGGPPLDRQNLRPAHGAKQPWGCPGNYGRGAGRMDEMPPTSRQW